MKHLSKKLLSHCVGYFLIKVNGLQTIIAEILSDIDAEIAALEAKLAKARQVKQGMMSELLSGKIRLNHD